ncbi:MAG: response regulator [Oscillospiraceae bacterium]|nr:response regulator [Oscillospiraceae bacterium]
MAYKALIADDEEMIREGLVKMLSGDAALRIVAQAEDGETAIELAKEHLPDILFVDVDMPFLNGLEFIEKLSDFLSGAAIVIITGYDDFRYIQKALRLGVFDYLLKPIMESTLFDTVDRAKAWLCQNNKEIKYLEWAKLQIEKNRRALTTSFFSGWLDGHYSEPEIDQQIEYLNLQVPIPCGITVVHISSKESLTLLEQGWNEDLLYYAAENIALELFSHLAPVSSYRNSGGDLVLLSACEPRRQWTEAGRDLTEALQKHLPVQIERMQVVCDARRRMPEVYLTSMEKFQAAMQCSVLVTETKRYIERNYGDMQLSLQAAAASQHVSPEHLSRVFRHETGVTFVDYVTQTRIRKAVELLLGSDLKIYSIAEQTGYSTQHYFSVAFKRALGVSPIEYRKGHHIGQHRVME